MKKNKLIKLFLTFCIFKLAFISIFLLINSHLAVTTYSEQKIEDLKNKITPSKVIAKTNKVTKIYNNMELSNFIREIPENTELEILKDHSTEVYFVKSDELKVKGWVSNLDIEIPEDPQTNKNELTKEEIETFVNLTNLKSATKYLVWVDIDRQKTYILNGKEKNWKLIREFICSTGVNKSPTTRGIFKTSDKGEWFFSSRLGSGAKYWVRFNNSYLFHSVAMDINQNIIDGQLGVRRSNGCVRLSLQDIEWFYNNIPSNTTVFIN